MTKLPKKQVSLKELAALLGLSPSTVSRAVSGGPDAHRISAETRERVLAAAAEYRYTANTLAKSLRQKRSYTVGVMVAEISEGYATAVLGGIEDELLKDGYFYFIVSHRHRKELLKQYPQMMIARSVEGIIAVDTALLEGLPVPVVGVSGRAHPEGTVHIELDHREAARLGLQHLKDLGHKRIAVLKGQKFSSDTAPRWNAIAQVARELELKMDPRLVEQLETDEPGTGPGREATERLLAKKIPFSAVFAFNDTSALGAIEALHKAGMQIPADVSVMGFDDVLAASTSNPPLTTIQQPLRAMGRMAAGKLLEMIGNEGKAVGDEAITVSPTLVVRGSTGQAGKS